MDLTPAERRELAAALTWSQRGDVVATGHGFVVEEVHHGDAFLAIAVGPQGRFRLLDGRLTMDGEAQFKDHTQVSLPHIT